MCRCHMQWYTRFRLLLFFFTDPAPTVIYTLSLHDALPICGLRRRRFAADRFPDLLWRAPEVGGDRKSTRLNSSHVSISYAVFCLKKKKNKTTAVSFYVM